MMDDDSLACTFASDGVILRVIHVDETDFDMLAPVMQPTNDATELHETDSCLGIAKRCAPSRLYAGPDPYAAAHTYTGGHEEGGGLDTPGQGFSQGGVAARSNVAIDITKRCSPSGHCADPGPYAAARACSSDHEEDHGLDTPGQGFSQGGVAARRKVAIDCQAIVSRRAESQGTSDTGVCNGLATAGQGFSHACDSARSEDASDDRAGVWGRGPSEARGRISNDNALYDHAVRVEVDKTGSRSYQERCACLVEKAGDFMCDGDANATNPIVRVFECAPSDVLYFWNWERMSEVMLARALAIALTWLPAATTVV
ncbi:hypothetical protein ACHHYP_20564 [Achlya hypogyna]|uniref:Uncharacterized protein n=1 Tax=Achlya hypogyna TaxID=1202772 RepID=A0A1V9YIT8_ACHHY|nr:hypothetical protein ACHHYP_20564 [Achlya hypogyna]